ncbi:MAG TPA: CDP-alcohol phosphatidyltransferase family protein [Acidimicrobiia bacterium]|nr:CDP-alcohol phosphatidyltransferase family protein [Acidimicrobiia bacterium]
MSSEQVSDRILTVPNLVSFVRLAAIPFFWWLLLGAENVTGATILFALVATTDWVDGYLARRLHQVSRLGKSLDPVADRLMIASAVIAGLIVDIVPPEIGWTLMAREIYMAILTVFLYARSAGTLTVRWLGKLATFVVYSSVGWFYLAAVGVLEPLFTVFAWLFGIVGLILYWITAFRYTGDAITRLRELESSASPQES